MTLTVQWLSHSTAFRSPPLRHIEHSSILYKLLLYPIIISRLPTVSNFPKLQKLTAVTILMVSATLLIGMISDSSVCDDFSALKNPTLLLSAMDALEITDMSAMAGRVIIQLAS